MEILIVDDTLENVRLAANVLSDYDISFARSGEEALELLEKEHYDLILLDVMMPGIDGYTTCQKLRKLPSHRKTPVIFLTAKTDKESIIKAFKAGGQDYISKPFNTEELLARVKNQLIYKQYQDQLVQQIHLEREQNKTKDLILLQQTKMAQMGESFAMMAHQWKQPLSAITAINMSLEVNMALDNIDKDEMLESIRLINENVRHLSKTIEEYKNFFKPKTSFESVSFQGLLDKTLLINQQIFTENNMTLNVHIQDKDFSFKTLINEMIQVMLVVMQNSVEACKDHTEKGIVDLTMSYSSKEICISIEDNGPGFLPENIEKAFDLHFSTKGKEGSGIGLYMVKKIIEDHLNGTITIANTQTGSQLKFCLPRDS